AVFAALQWRALGRQAAGIEAQVERMNRTIQQTQTLIDQQREALQLAKDARQDAIRSSTPIVTLSEFFLDHQSPSREVTARVVLSNSGNSAIAGGTNRMMIEVRKDEPPSNYQPKWIVERGLSMQRQSGDVTVEAQRTLSETELQLVNIDPNAKTLY